MNHIKINFKTYSYTLIVISIFLMLIPSHIEAQEYFDEGILVLEDGRRIEGFISIPFGEKMIRSVKFKTDKGSKEVVYSANEVDRLSTDRIKMVGRTVDVDRSPWELNDLDTIMSQILTKESLFITLIFSGELELYRLENNKLGRSYYIFHADSLLLLSHKKYYLNRTLETSSMPKRSLMENNRYKGQLKYVMSSCQKAMARIDKMDFNELELIELFDVYDECHKRKSDYKKTKYLKNDITISGGFSHHRYEVSTPLYGPYDLEYEISEYGPSIQLTMETKWENNQGRTTLVNELIYSNFSAKTDYVQRIEANWTAHFVLDDQVHHLSSAHLMRYYIKKDARDVFLNVGFNFLGRNFSAAKVELTESNLFGTAISSHFSSPALSRFGWTAGAGVNRNRLLAQFRASLRRPHALSESERSHFQTGVCIGYRL